MRAEGVSLLAELGGVSASFVSLGKASNMHVGVYLDVKALPRLPYSKAIAQVREQVRSCTALPDLPPSSIAVVYSKGSTAQKWYATPPCPVRAEKTLASALEARGKKRKAVTGADGSASDSEYEDKSDSTTSDDGSASADDEAVPAMDMLSELDRRVTARNACTDELYAWAAACSDDDEGFALPGDEHDIEPATLGDGRVQYPEVVFTASGGDNMLGMLITEEVRRRQARAAATAPAKDTVRPAAPRARKQVARTKLRVPLKHLGVRDEQGILRSPAGHQTWYLGMDGRTVLGTPPQGCKTHGAVRDGVLVGR